MLNSLLTQDCYGSLYSTVKWQKETVQLKDTSGTLYFEKEVSFPPGWSQNAKTIVASKYFTNYEQSLDQMLRRVVDKLSEAGINQNLLNQKSASIFSDELYYVLVNQLASFNSPVYFNVGVEGRKQQCSACFLLEVDDHMESILDWIKTEGFIFKGGSGSGVNISRLRGEGEPIHPKGSSSGPLSFMAAADCVSGVIKSGSVARRAAKMVLMNVDHPDIFKFINCKVEAEEILRKFNNLGYNIDVNSRLLSFIPYQNANNSVVVSDLFLDAVKKKGPWGLKTPTDNHIINTTMSHTIFDEIANAAWKCADPGLFYVDTINKWHTCKADGLISTTNPCGEYLFLNNTSCNLSSINLLKFIYRENKEWHFDVNAFVHICNLMITAQEIIVDYADYPTPKITEMSRRYRTLGLGYSNLGAMLMCLGFPYDSDEGRNLAACITSLMTSTAYQRSVEIAEVQGPFEAFERNKDSFMGVMKLHADAHKKLNKHSPSYIKNYNEIYSTAEKNWSSVCKAKVFRNAQVTLLAPTGTISFMMDCDTTGVEPELALKKTKTLVGGGKMQIVNQNIKSALQTLGYNDYSAEKIIDYIDKNNTVVGCPEFNKQDLPVFDCSFNTGGNRYIRPMAHVEMVAAVQPFLSGGVSKTCNLPAEATVEDIKDIYMKAWELGLKDISIYRDNTKVAQPLVASSNGKVVSLVQKPKEAPAPMATRKRLPDTRQSITHKFNIGGHEGYLTVGLYPDSTPGEIFINMSKEGSTISGLIDSFATSISMCLQYGVPLKSLIDKFKYTRFEPNGFTGAEDIKSATSVVDYIFRWLDLKFLLGKNSKEKIETPLLIEDDSNKIQIGDLCPNCGSTTIQAGACRSCPTCGDSSGCG
jgi:ribonucleoside-diphosphate reductase alpha chain